MSEMMKVKFLNESYEISSDILKFLEYRKHEVLLLEKLSSEVISIMNRNNSMRPKDAIDYFDTDIEKLQRMMRREVDKLLQILLNEGIYSVSLDDLLSGTEYSNMSEIAIDVAEKFVDIARMHLYEVETSTQYAYSQAASSITGTGFSLFTTSFTTAMAYAVFEGSVLNSQAKKADKQYEKAVQDIKRNSNDKYNFQLGQVLVKDYYPKLADIITSFSSKVISNFLKTLIINGKFNFQLMSQYNQTKSDNILSHLNRVADKEEILRQAFIACPYNDEVYRNAFNLGLMDIDTYQTLRTLKLEKCISQDIERKFLMTKNKMNLSNDLLEIYMIHKNLSKDEAIKYLYTSEITQIQEFFNLIKKILRNDRQLVMWIKNCVCESSEDFVRLDERIIKSVVERYFRDKAPLSLIKKLIELNYFSVKEIKDILPTSTEDLINTIIDETISTTVLKEENVEDYYDEVIVQLTSKIVDCLEEAKKRYASYKEAKALQKKNIKSLEKELNELIKYRDSLGFFKFSLKNEVTLKITIKKEEIDREENNIEVKNAYTHFKKLIL